MKPANKKVVMFIAHPGHVLRVYHWFKAAKPVVFSMTDGAGRLGATTALLEKTGASQGSIYGRWTDAAVYEAILRKDVDQFIAATREFADVLAGSEFDHVVGDAEEGYNCTHDLGRYMLNSAIAIAEKETGRRIPNYEFLLFGPPNQCPDALRESAIRVGLDEAALDEKLAVAENYQADFIGEVKEQIGKFGRSPFMVEYLTPTGIETEKDFLAVKPWYESHGEKQVANGKYKHVIRYREHFVPLIAELRAKLGLGAPMTVA